MFRRFQNRPRGAEQIVLGYKWMIVQRRSEIIVGLITGSLGRCGQLSIPNQALRIDPNR